MRLTDDQWSLVQPILFPPGASSRRGRPAHDSRLVLDAILTRLARRCSWRRLPPGSPPWQTCFRRYLSWKESGLLAQVIIALFNDLLSRGRFDPDKAYAARLVLFSEQAGQVRIYYDARFPRNWQLETALLYYQHAVEIVESDRAPFADYPLMELLSPEILKTRWHPGCSPGNLPVVPNPL